MPNRIKELRNNAKLSQQGLSIRTGIGKSTIESYEVNDVTPRIRKAQVLAEFFKVSVSGLLGYSPLEIDRDKISDNQFEIKKGKYNWYVQQDRDSGETEKLTFDSQEDVFELIATLQNWITAGGNADD